MVITKPTLDKNEIMAIIPHRPPMLLLDQVTTAGEESVQGQRIVMPNDVFLAGHFPDNPIVPGVILIEAMAQLSLVLYAYNFDMGPLMYLTRSQARFYAPARPGDKLIINCKKKKYLQTMGISENTIYINETMIAQAELYFASQSALTDLNIL